MGKLAEAKSEILEVDFLCLNIIQNLSKENIKEQYLSKEFKALNYFLEENKVGYVFKLIDCMNILAAITFYMGRYEDSYESLLLLLELYSSLS